MTAAILLAIALACLHAFLRGHGAVRVRHRFARRAARQMLWFALPAIAGLALLGRLDALIALPREFVPARVALATLLGGTLAPADLARVTGIGILLGGLAVAWVERRWRRPFGLGDVETILPRTRAELPWGVVLSLSAGIGEELFFRLLVPLLVAIPTGSAIAGFAIATALFGGAHRYQGPVGIAATMLSGALLTGAYLLTGALWVAIALHVAIDLNALVLRPVLSGRIRN
ncbi:CPBP family intramembrane glutamic endopeptidase [Sphingomonas adhaesiva]|uniref:CPBP family intramembrane glutamic endopeptidase n=1 Tax=Sphingomonas adhaesiva TaxID=28212 RepID=UPI002FF9181C